MLSDHEFDGALGWLRGKLSVEDFQRAANEHNAIVVRIRQETKAERDAARKELEDWRQDVRNVMAEPCAPDERHCTCVPALRRELRELQSQRMVFDSDLQRKELQIAKAEALRLREALEKYGRHNCSVLGCRKKHKCKESGCSGLEPCTCGLEQALSPGPISQSWAEERRLLEAVVEAAKRWRDWWRQPRPAEADSEESDALIYSLQALSSFRARESAGEK